MTTHSTNDKDTVVTGFAVGTAATTAAEPAATTTTTAKTAGVDALAALRAQLSRDAAGYHFHKGEHMYEEYAKKGVNFVTAKNGMFRVTVTKIGVFATKLGDVKQGVNIPGLVDLKEGVTLTVPKIPFEHWLQILTFYRDVHTKDTTEASALFFYNHDKVELPTHYMKTDGTPSRELKGVLENGQLIVYCPQQRNSGTLSEFHMDSMVEWLRQNTTPLCETHSHHTMGAFWSGTDNSNENMTQFYGVYGHIKDGKPMFLFRYVHGDDKTDISMFELFEKPKAITITHVELGGKTIEIQGTAEYEGPWPRLEYPDDWMAQHSKSVYVATTYGNAGGGYGAHGRGGAYGGYSGPGAQGSGAHTQPGSVAHGGAGQGSDDDYEDHWFRNGFSRHQASAQAVDLDEHRGKKNTADKQAIKQSAIALRKVIETSTSTVEIISLEHLSPWAQEQVEDLVQNLADAGFDHFIANILRELT